MRYRASIIGEPVKVLNTDEISALGACVSAIGASGNAGILERLKTSLPVERTIYPDPQLCEGLEKAFDYYKQLLALQELKILR
jgi:sugar (pentulose or hexulose) kinase